MTDNQQQAALSARQDGVGAHAAHHAAHDEIHVVAPTWQPLLLSLGITMALAGTVLSPLMSIVGLVLMIVSLVNWISEMRGDFRATRASAGDPRDEPFA